MTRTSTDGFPEPAGPATTDELSELISAFAAAVGQMGEQVAANAYAMLTALVEAAYQQGRADGVAETVSAIRGVPAETVTDRSPLSAFVAQWPDLFTQRRAR